MQEKRTGGHLLNNYKKTETGTLSLQRTNAFRLASSSRLHLFITDDMPFLSQLVVQIDLLLFGGLRQRVRKLSI